MSDTTISTTGAAAAATAQGSSPQPNKAQIHEAAQKFEALFLRQVLAETRKANFGESMLNSQGTQTFREMQDSNLADNMAKQGTLGFAKMIEAQLARQTGAGNGE